MGRLGPAEYLTIMGRRFSPVELDGCELWLSADRGVTLAGPSTDKARWIDLSTNRNHAAQETDANKPALDGQALDFDGSTQHLVGPAITSLAGAFTIGIALQATDNTGGSVRVYHGHGTPATNGCEVRNSGGGTPTRDTTTFNGVGTTVSWGSATTNAETWVYRHDGATTADFALNGSHESSQTQAAAVAPTTSYGVGARGNGGNDAEVTVWAIIVYSDRKSDAVVANINAYLTALRAGTALPSWRPTDETNLVLWLERPDLYAGQAVSAWANQNGDTGGAMQQTTAANRPVLIVDPATMCKGLHFDSTDDFMDHDGAASLWTFLHDGSGGTMCAEHTPHSGGPIGTASVLDTLGVIASRIGATLEWDNGTDQRPFVRIGNGSGTYVYAAASSVDKHLINVPEFTTFRNQSSAADEIHVRVDESNVLSAAYAETPSSSDPFGALRIGASLASSRFFDGVISEVAIYSRYLELAEVLRLEKYANAKYGLT